MCDKCFSTLKHLVKPHDAALCPLKRALYCGVCAAYGHSPAACPDTVTQMFRVPHYMEQLIPPSLMAEYGITSRTPIGPLPTPELSLAPMCLTETSESLRAALISIDVKPKICQAQNSKEEIKVNKARLITEMESVGRKVEFIDQVVPPYTQKYKLKKKAAAS